jgi:hypothetical protein
MAVWGTVAVGAGSVLMGSINANKANKANKDIAQTPTRSTGIEDLLRDVTSTTSETGSTTEAQQQLENLIQQEQAREASETATRNDALQQSAQNTAQQQQGTTTRGSAESQAALSQLVGGGDGQAAVEAMIGKILREGKAGISNVGTRSGSFGSTTEQLLNNDLMTRAAEAGVGQQNIQQQLQLEAIKAAQAGTEATTGSTLGQATGTTTDSSTGSETGNRTSDSTSQQQRESNNTATSDTSKTGTTNSTDRQTTLTDSLTDPRDGVSVFGQLKDLVDRGIQPTGGGITPPPEVGVGTSPTSGSTGSGGVGVGIGPGGREGPTTNKQLVSRPGNQIGDQIVNQQGGQLGGQLDGLMEQAFSQVGQPTKTASVRPNLAQGVAGSTGTSPIGTASGRLAAGNTAVVAPTAPINSPTGQSFTKPQLDGILPAEDFETDLDNMLTRM